MGYDNFELINGNNNLVFPDGHSANFTILLTKIKINNYNYCEIEVDLKNLNI